MDDPTALPDPLAPPHALVAAVRAALPGLARGAWRPVPGGRVNRLWRCGALMVKLHDPAGASPLFPNDPGAEARALADLAPLGLAPRLRARGAGWIAYDQVPGRPWRRGPGAVAQALARVHGLDGGAFRDLPSGSAAVLAQAAGILAQCRGALPPAPPDPGVAPHPAPVLVHGDAVPGNAILRRDGQVVLIDWQCPGRGDPAEDLAIFLSPAMQRLYRGRPLSADEAAAFLAAYPCPDTVARLRTMWPVFRWRMAAHCLWKAQRGAPGYAEALALELG